MRAPRALACSSSSSTTTPAPPAITKPSRLMSYGREAVAGVSLYFDDIAPMASNSTDRVQSSSSQPPAKMMSCLPSAMISEALPVQWLEVAQADEIE